MVSDLKKEIMNELKDILSKKDKEMEVLKSQVTLMSNHVSTVKHALDKKLMNWSCMIEGFVSALKLFNIILTENLRKFWKKLSIL